MFVSEHRHRCIYVYKRTYIYKPSHRRSICPRGSTSGRHFRGLRNYHGGLSQSLSPNPPGQGPTQPALPLVRCGVPVPATWDPPPGETVWEVKITNGSHCLDQIRPGHAQTLSWEGEGLLGG